MCLISHRHNLSFHEIIGKESPKSEFKPAGLKTHRSTVAGWVPQKQILRWRMACRKVHRTVLWAEPGWVQAWQGEALGCNVATVRSH